MTSVFYRHLRISFRVLIRFFVYDRVSKRPYFCYISEQGDDNTAGNQLLWLSLLAHYIVGVDRSYRWLPSLCHVVSYVQLLEKWISSNGESNIIIDNNAKKHIGSVRHLREICFIIFLYITGIAVIRLIRRFHAIGIHPRNRFIRKWFL